jgi:8-oxo-dGTP pyrophosphatase MutT (NUDIX family)
MSNDPLARLSDDARRLLAGPPPWAELEAGLRRSITVRAVLDALGSVGQLGAAPGGEVARDDPVAPWRGKLLEDAPVDAQGSASAVLVALFEEDGLARVVLTRRSAELRTHRGQVSFPGGRIDPGEDAAAGALREANEEIGIDPGAVEIVGWLHPLYTLNATLILPVVGVLAGRPVTSPNPDEVARVFDVTLAALVADGAYRSDLWDPYEAWSSTGPQPRELWFFDVEGERVWGATARMLHELALIALGLPLAP